MCCRDHLATGCLCAFVMCSPGRHRHLCSFTGGLHMHLDGAVLGTQLLQEAVRAFGAIEDELGKCEGVPLPPCFCVLRLEADVSMLRKPGFGPLSAAPVQMYYLPSIPL